MSAAKHDPSPAWSRAKELVAWETKHLGQHFPQKAAEMPSPQANVAVRRGDG